MSVFNAAAEASEMNLDDKVLVKNILIQIKVLAQNYIYGYFHPS
jgi:hypothetical protein